jgi:hypothetical protein
VRVSRRHFARAIERPDAPVEQALTVGTPAGLVAIVPARIAFQTPTCAPRPAPPRRLLEELASDSGLQTTRRERRAPEAEREAARQRLYNVHFQ